MKSNRKGLTKKLILNLGLTSLLVSCASGSLTTNIDPNKNPVTSVPQAFQSPQIAMSQFAQESRLPKRNQTLQKLVAGSLKALLDQQTLIKKELSLTNQLALQAGYSYEFDLESFCVNAGVERPTKGDGLFLGNVEGQSKLWLPQILQQYESKRVSQNDAQVLIWSLLSGSRFDELNSENKNNLLKLFPDAPIRFGNSLIEDSATSFITAQIPTELVAAKDQFSEYQNLLQDTHAKFQDIEQTLSPYAQRRDPLPVGWLKHEDGYYIHLAADGYQKVHVQIYVPENLHAKVYFKPTKQIALPGKGQRLALSSNVVPSDLEDELNRRFKKLTGSSLGEAAFVAKHPLDALTIYKLAQKSLNLTWNNFDSSHLFQDDKADAFRHFVWSSMITKEIGASKANEFLEAHENYPGNEPRAKAMDLFNNERGIEFAKSYTGEAGIFEKKMTEAAFQKIKNKELRWLK